MLFYRLDKDIPAEKIVQDIQNLVQKFSQSNPQDIPILTISIKTISQENTSIIPKIENKSCSI